jgi:5'-3' exonuclease
MRDDGHSVLLDIITSFTSKNILLITPTLDISIEGVIELFKVLSTNESFRICKYINKKQMFANNIETELNIGENNWPLSHIEESILMNKKQLCSKWQDIYITFFNGFNIDKICKEYLYGIQWIWAYYKGRTDVCFNWFYPHSLPPLWQWLSMHLSINKLPSFPDIILVTVNDIKPIEQLALVLPLESWSLIPPSVERSIPFLAPQYYPTEFSFESIGKRYFWECEAMIPIPSILDIKVIVK